MNAETLKKLDRILRDPLDGLTWENRINAADACADNIALQAEVERLRRVLKKIERQPDYILPSPQEIARAGLADTREESE